MLKGLCKKSKKKKGFTLMELIIVIAIIAIIAMFAIPNFMRVRNRANIDSDVNLGRNIAHATEVLITEGSIDKKTDEGKTEKTITLKVGTDNTDADAKKIQDYLKEGSLKLKSKDAAAATTLTVTVDAEGKVTNIQVDKDNILYTTTEGKKPTGAFNKDKQ